MAYLNTDTRQYPLSEMDIKLANPNTSFPHPFSPGYPYVWVFPTPVPAHDPMAERVVETTPEAVNDTWQQRWQVVPRFVDYTDAQGTLVTAAEQEAQARAATAQAQAAALQNSVVNATQARLDAFAKTRNYDNILSACTYATSAVPKFQAEGQYAVNARDNTWATLYQILADVQANNRPMPANFAEIEPELPVLAWPN